MDREERFYAMLYLFVFSLMAGALVGASIQVALIAERLKEVSIVAVDTY